MMMGNVFPNWEDFDSDYKDSDYGSMFSTLQLNSMLAGGREFRLGDSTVSVSVPPLQSGEDGLKMFAESAIKTAEKIKEALPQMRDKKYVDFFTHYLKDYDENGIWMPMKGQVVKDGKFLAEKEREGTVETVSLDGNESLDER